MEQGIIRPADAPVRRRLATPPLVNPPCSERGSLADRALIRHGDWKYAMRDGDAATVRELDAGIAFIDRALQLNLNLAAAWIASGWVRNWLGEPDLAIEHLARAMRLSPLGPYTNQTRTAAATAHFFAGRYEEASSWAAMVLREWPDFQTALRIAAASYALVGRVEDAKSVSKKDNPPPPQSRYTGSGKTTSSLAQ